jgi:hypothetical protein
LQEDSNQDSYDFIGWEWDQAVQTATEKGLILIPVIINSCDDPKNSTLRIVRHEQLSEGLCCICVYEDWS